MSAAIEAILTSQTRGSAELKTLDIGGTELLDMRKPEHDHWKRVFTPEGLHMVLPEDSPLARLRWTTKEEIDTGTLDAALSVAVKIELPKSVRIAVGADGGRQHIVVNDEAVAHVISRFYALHRSDMVLNQPWNEKNASIMVMSDPATQPDHGDIFSGIQQPLKGTMIISPGAIISVAFAVSQAPQVS